MKKHNYINAICYGSDIYDVDRVYKRFKTFETLTDARKYAKQYTNAHVVRIYFSDDGDYAGCREF